MGMGRSNPSCLLPSRSLSRLPPGHRFFPDCQRETTARWIQWAMWSGHPKPDVWFATLTFKTYVHERRAFMILKTFLAHLDQGYHKKPTLPNTIGLRRTGRLRWIAAIEWQVRNVIHYHLLISGAGLSELSRKRWEVRWMTGDRSAGFCRIYPADIKAGPYLAKYIHKGGDLLRGGYWRGLKTPKSVSCCQPNLGMDPDFSWPLDSSVESSQGLQAADTRAKVMVPRE
jgi:hypothetical protein